MDRFQSRLHTADTEVRDLLARIPLQTSAPLPPEWLRCEMLERFEVINRAPPLESITVLEVGAGAHAISTVPLALRAGRAGRILAVEKARWSQFRPTVTASGLGGRIRPIAGDARKLPLRSNSADLAVCVHGLRSLRGEANLFRVLQEMFRVSSRIFLAETLPIARSDAQAAHLVLYGLRDEVFSATGGRHDDLPYFPLQNLVTLVESVGGVVEKTETIDVDLPHFLGGIPRNLVESISDRELREGLLRRWDDADQQQRRFGEDHPPVGVLTASRG